ncbi:hypothetical protein BHM03_00018603 [Ensete ventricosum]|nr:hypothetical protein BHM03_00018603 [Ensete ventricosum]
MGRSRKGKRHPTHASPSPFPFLSFSLVSSPRPNFEGDQARLRLIAPVQYGATFQRLDGRSVPSQIQIATPSSLLTTAGNAPDNSACETYHIVPLPQPYDADPRYFRLQREGLVSRREKSMSHTQEELHTLRRNGSSSAVETLAYVLLGNWCVLSISSCVVYTSNTGKMDLNQNSLGGT